MLWPTHVWQLNINLQGVKQRKKMKTQAVLSAARTECWGDVGRLMLRRRLLQVAAARSPSDQVELTDRPSLLQVAPTPPPPPAPPPPGGQRPQKETPDLVVCLQQSQWWCCTALQQPAGIAAPPLRPLSAALHGTEECLLQPADGGSSAACALVLLCSLCTPSLSVCVQSVRRPTACVYLKI